MRVQGPLSVRPLVPAQTSASSGEVVGDEPLVAGVDLGTTSVSAVVIGELSGRQLGRATVPNQQGMYGADVLARVAADMDGQADLLRQAAQSSVTDALCAACGRACSCIEDVVRVVVAGNSVMASALCGESLESFSAHPFEAPFDDVRALPPSWHGELEVSDRLETLVLPPVVSFVGGDTTAALLAAGMIDEEEPTLLVDMGTNAEVAISSRGRLNVTSAAAGPALEAVGTRSGGPYGEGAVVEVGASASGDIDVAVVGGGPPLWLAGSGLISAVAMLRRFGHLDPSGLMCEEGPLGDRFAMDGDIKAFAIGDGQDAILLTQTDIRAFQQAKAGVAAAVYLSATRSRLRPRKVSRVVVTGALGGAAGVEELVELGVLPEDLKDRTEVLEAAALTGAGMLATDPGLVEEVMSYTSKAEHVDLAGDPRFSATFMAALELKPYTLQKGF
jgi:uncharacterized 2Fe-2S/4Fe-4S cluster protein (DUF4445 family)